MLTRKLSNLKNNLEVARTRVRVLLDSPRYGYIGGQGDKNLGDDVMFDAAQDLIRHGRIVPYSFPSHERRLAYVRLSGRHYFDQVILGGGTFINPYGLETTRMALRHGLPMWTLGTGVGSGGFGMSQRPDLVEWKALLSDFRRIGVRGPRSKAALDGIGVTRAEVIGDLALTLALEKPVEPAREPPRFGVNVMLPPANEKHSWNEETLLPPFVDAIRELEAAGFVPVFFGMHRHDLEPLRRLVTRLGRPNETLHFPQTAQEFFTLLGPCSFNVCVRLHAAVLSTCAGVPPVSFGYREKCLDFMESMSLQDWALELSTVRPADIHERILQLSREAPNLRASIHSRARAYRDGILAYVAALCPAEARRASV